MNAERKPNLIRVVPHPTDTPGYSSAPAATWETLKRSHELVTRFNPIPSRLPLGAINTPTKSGQ